MIGSAENPPGPEAVTIDARGLSCPLPVIRMEAALRRIAPGASVRIMADDPVAVVDIPHFAQAGGHQCRRVPCPDGACVFLVTRGENP
ncbi:MAG: sulfurtransferase TusA family protein [Parvularculaceae bacterium]|nr:sulfurtransferase TusA family protein [Parvularculaceae bacterium]